MEEKWKPVNGFTNYEVSDEGRIRNKRTGRKLRVCPDDLGYERVSLKEGNKKYNRRVHRLVAEAFVDCGHDHTGLNVTHIDNDRKNNKADNLEWMTRSEIVRKTYSNKQKQIHKIRCVETGEVWQSISECCEDTGLNRSSISKCLNNPVVKTFDGRHFEYID